MKLNVHSRRKLIIGSVVVLLTTTPSFALFGVGDIVFDPTSYASLVPQLTTLEMQYNMVKNNVTHFSFKQQWQTTLMRWKISMSPIYSGKRPGMNIALNTNSPSASSTGWKAATRPDGQQHQHLSRKGRRGQRADSQLAMIETSDSDLPRLPHCSRPVPGGRTKNATANSALLAQQFDGSDAPIAKSNSLTY